MELKNMLALSIEPDKNHRKYKDLADPLVAIKAQNGATNGRSYARLPSYHPLFLKDPLEAWLYFAELRKEFNEHENSTLQYPRDMIPLKEFLIGALIYGMRGKMLKEFGPSEENQAVEEFLQKLNIQGREVIQVSDPFKSKP